MIPYSIITILFYPIISIHCKTTNYTRNQPFPNNFFAHM